MIRCMCIVQEGQTAAQKQTVLQSALDQFSNRVFGEAADINWITVPPQSGFTARHPSTSSIVSMTANKPVPQDARADLLVELCGIWTEETGCTLNEVVGIINDPQAA